MRVVLSILLALVCVTLCAGQACTTPPAVVNYNNPFVPELGFKEAKTFYPIYASATAADGAAGVSIIKAAPANLGLKKPFLMSLLNACGLPFQMSVSEMQKPKDTDPMAKAVGACVRHLHQTKRISSTDPKTAVAEITKKVKTEYEKLDEADYQHIERVLNYSKGTKGREHTVQAALAMVGHVSALNRGDGSKYGWLNIFHFYRRALSKSLFYDKQNTKELWELGNFKKDGKHVKDVWSWCGIFATWSQTAGGLEAAWWKPGAGLQGITAKNNGPNTIDKAQPGDFLYWSGSCSHMSVFLKYDSAKKQVWSIDGNGMEQGVSVNARDIKGLLGWRCTHGCEDGNKTDKLPASFDLQHVLTAAKSAKPGASTPPAVGSKSGSAKGGSASKAQGANSAKGGKKKKFY